MSRIACLLPEAPSLTPPGALLQVALAHSPRVEEASTCVYLDAAGLEGFAQHFEHVAVELGQLVEEQHAVMRERDLSGPRHRAAADQRDRRCRVVRRAERARLPCAADRRDLQSPRRR